MQPEIPLNIIFAIVDHVSHLIIKHNHFPDLAKSAIGEAEVVSLLPLPGIQDFQLHSNSISL
jgi:hypothetical protein